MRSSYGPKWSPLQAFFFQINLLSNLNILKLALGDWSCSGNIKQDFLMISPICCFTKKVVNKRTYISETSPNHPDYPWFSKCTLNLGLEKHMLINSADMSHLPPSAIGLLVPLFRPSLIRMLFFFYISIYGSSHWGCSVKKGVFIKKRLQQRCFPVKFAKFLRTPNLKNICERLLLNLWGLQRSSTKRF